jgi:SAM-dependent methyltransferase
MSMSERAPYDEVANEYYSEKLHPTCANFGELSSRFLVPQIEAIASQFDTFVEVGAGRSIVAPILARAGRSLDELTLLDISAAMLAHSQEWIARGARFVVGDARQTSFPDGSVGVVIASLCDPFNDREFWSEVARILCKGGRCLFTMPAVEWSSSFRSELGLHAAEFWLENGRTVSVPSLILSVPAQREMLEGVGLMIDNVCEYRSADVTGTLSAKLRGPAQPVLRGFAARKG